MCDSVDVYNEVLRTARKTHKCTECKTKIEPGTQYWDEAYLMDSEWYKSKICLDCKALHLYVHWVAFKYEEDVCWELGNIEGFFRDSDCIEYNEETDKIESLVDWIEITDGKIRLSKVARISIDIMMHKAYRVSQDNSYKQAYLLDKVLCQLKIESIR